MKILHILDHSLPLHSGYVFRTLGILRAQRESGWETVHLTSPKQAEHTAVDLQSDALLEEIDGWTFHRTSHRSSRLANFLGVGAITGMAATSRRLTQVVAGCQPNILHAHSPVLNAFPTLWVGRRLKLPVVYEIRAFWEDAAVDLGTTTANSLSYKATRRMETFAVKCADAVTTICNGHSLIDLLVFPRRSIRLTDLVTPLKPLESMAQGILCVASDVGGHKELIRDGKTGYLFAAADVAALAASVQRAFSAESQWPEIRHAGRIFVETERNWTASVSNYKPVYEALLKDR